MVAFPKLRFLVVLHVLSFTAPPPFFDTTNEHCRLVYDIVDAKAQFTMLHSMSRNGVVIIGLNMWLCTSISSFASKSLCFSLLPRPFADILISVRL
jgi:hypothetical protein